jgi:hypothetical protein
MPIQPVTVPIGPCRPKPGDRSGLPRFGREILEMARSRHRFDQVIGKLPRADAELIRR